MAYQSVNPYDGKILKTFKELTDNQLDTALGNAATCFEDWGTRLSPGGRPWSQRPPVPCAPASPSLLAQ